MTTDKVKANKFYYGAFAAFILFCLFFFFFFFGVARAESKKASKHNLTGAKQAAAIEAVWKEDAEGEHYAYEVKYSDDVKSYAQEQKGAAGNYYVPEGEGKAAYDKEKNEAEAEKTYIKYEDYGTEPIYLAEYSTKDTHDSGRYEWKRKS